MNLFYFRFPFLMITLLVLGSCGNSEPQNKPEAAPAPFPVVTLAKSSITTYKSYPTTLEGEVNSEVRPKISGYIQRVHVSEGQVVKKGQLLFSLETQSLNQDAAAAKANVDAAQVEVDKLIPLVEKNIISSVQLSTAKAKLQQVKSTYNSVNANINYGAIKSPVNGVVGSINYREGSLVSPQDQAPITTVSMISKVFANFSMNEKEYLNFLSNADQSKSVQETIDNLPKVSLTLATGKPYSEKGTVETIAGSINQQTGTVTFRASFNNANGLLRNGSSGTIDVPQLYDNKIIVPAESTFERQGKKFVYRVVQDTLVSTPITVSESTGKVYIVEEGLEVGTEILAKGINKVRPGTQIKPVLTPMDSILTSFGTTFK